MIENHFITGIVLIANMSALNTFCDISCFIHVHFVYFMKTNASTQTF